MLGALIVIFLLLVFYLFKPSEPWVADLLKIAIGVFAGAGAVAIKDKISQNYQDQSSLMLDNSQISVSGNKLAGRDINETIQNIEKAFGDIKDSVVHQDNKIEQFLSSSGQLDHWYIVVSIFSMISNKF